MLARSLIRMHVVKAGISYHVIPDLELGLSTIAQSSQPLRGDEANVGPFLSGYVVLNARASYRLLPEVTLFVRAQNLLNRKYETFGVLANPGEVLPNCTRCSGLPRAAFVDIRMQLKAAMELR